MNPKLQNIDHIHVFVADRQEALDWYSNFLGLKPLEKLISLPKSGPLTIKNDEGNITIALFKGEPQNNRCVIAFKVTGEEFINCHNKIINSLNEKITIVIQWSEECLSCSSVCVLRSSKLKQIIGSIDERAIDGVIKIL